MTAARLFSLLYPLLAAGLAHAGNEAIVANPANMKVIALPAVKQPVAPVAVAPVTPGVKPSAVKIVAPDKLPPGLVKVEPPAGTKALPGKTVDVRLPPPVNDRVGAMKPGQAPMISPLVTPPGGSKGTRKEMDRSQLDAKNQAIQDERDAHGSIDDTQGTRLQTAADRRMRVTKTLSDVQKKYDDSTSGITQNLK